jgi:hypothetical protein
MQFSPSLYYCFSFMSICFLQRPVLKYFLSLKVRDQVSHSEIAASKVAVIVDFNL